MLPYILMHHSTIQNPNKFLTPFFLAEKIQLCVPSWKTFVEFLLSAQKQFQFQTKILVRKINRHKSKHSRDL